jgi:hypothetical protein
MRMGLERRRVEWKSVEPLPLLLRLHGWQRLGFHDH